MIESLECRTLLSTYYLSAAGNDAVNDGSQAAPWATLAKVNSLSLRPGDAVLLNGGDTFAGSLSFDALDGGSAAAPVTVDSYGVGRATIAAGNGNGIVGRNTAGISIANLNVVGAGQSPNTYSGIAFDNAQAGNTKLGFVHVDNVAVSGFGKYGITIGGSNGKSGFDDVRITNANVYGNTLGGIETHGVFSGSATAYANTHVYVGHAVVHDNPGYAGSPNHSGDGIVLSDADGVTIERSEAYNNGAANTHVGGPVGIWVWDVNNAVIQNNESHHNRTNSTADGGGFDLDGGVTNSVVQYNYSHDNAGAGYGIYQFSGARPFKNDTVRYNVSANDARKNGYGAIDFWNGGSGISNVNVYNNTVYLTPAASGAPKALRFTTGTSNVTVRNNIFQTTGGVQLADIEAKQTNLLLQGNDYWSSGAAFSAKVFAKTYTSFSAYVSGSGYEKLGTSVVGKNVNPFLADPTNIPTVGVASIDVLESSLDGYKLTAASPLRDAGLDLFATFGINPGPRDFFGNLLGSTRTDIGAGEFA